MTYAKNLLGAIYHSPLDGGTINPIANVNPITITIESHYHAV